MMNFTKERNRDIENSFWVDPIQKEIPFTKELYLEDTYNFQCDSKVLGVGRDPKGPFVILDQTVFYPQGGGQPSDQGSIYGKNISIDVIKVMKDLHQIKHYVASEIHPDHVGIQVHCSVDAERRILNARYHTAAHLLGAIGERIAPCMRARKGHSFPGEAYVEFAPESEHPDMSKDDPDFSHIQKEITEIIAQNNTLSVFHIDPLGFEEKYYKLSYSIPQDKKFRAVQIGNLPPVPCGGTHVTDLSQLGSVLVTKVKSKNHVTRVSYEIV